METQAVKRLFAGIVGLCLIATGAISGWQSRDSNYNTNVASGGGGGRTCTDDTASGNFLARTSGLSNAEADAYCVLIKGLRLTES
jgi:hypothetical protein